MSDPDFTNYTSPFSWRYGSPKMRQIFSEEKKYKTWRKIWTALVKAQSKFGLVSKKELADLEKNQENIDIERILEIEKDTRHDVVAAIREFAEKTKIGEGKIHLGATSMDIDDNASMIRIIEAINLVEGNLKMLLNLFVDKIKKYADTPCMGYTHLQPAEPTTLGYRFAFYAQDLLTDFEFLQFVKKNLKTKGIKGAVGTSASYTKLVGNDVDKLENLVMKELSLKAAEVTSQTYPRKTEVLVGALLTSIAQTLYKFAFDVRLMQSPGFGEWQEPFGKTQVGSSAMPFKKNPIKSEQICSLSRLVFHLSDVLRDNAASMLLERTLDDSANRRVVIPEIFLATDEILNSAKKIIDGLIINDFKIKKNLEAFWPFSVTEAILIESVKNGADRQKMHESLREISMQAWNIVQKGLENPMKDMLMNNIEIKEYLSTSEIEKLMDVNSHIGNSKTKSLKLVRKIKKL